MVTLCETAPAMVRKVAGGRLEAAIQAMLTMMTGTKFLREIEIAIDFTKFFFLQFPD